MRCYPVKDRNDRREKSLFTKAPPNKATQPTRPAAKVEHQFLRLAIESVAADARPLGVQIEITIFCFAIQ
jgi:hypothetical protein